MFLNPAVISLVGGSLLTNLFMAYASWNGAQILRHWDIRSGSARQLMLERKTYLVGTLLNVKPLLTLANGRVDALERVRTKRKALDRMVEVAAQRAQETGHPYRVVVVHA